MTHKDYSRKILGCLFSLLFAAIIFTGFAPEAAKADGLEWNGRNTDPYGYTKLSAEQKYLYELLEHKLLKLAQSDGFAKDTWSADTAIVTVSVSDTEFIKEVYYLVPAETVQAALAELTIADIEKTYTTFIAENPAYFFVGASYGHQTDKSSGKFGNNGSLTIYPDSSYLTPASRLRVESYIENVSEKWFEWADAYDDIGEIDAGRGDYVKARLIHDYIINRIEYAKNANDKPSDEWWAHTLAGVFTGQGAVCEGYAKAYKYMLDLIGIPNIYITGNGNNERHAWNAIQLEDENWYLVDVTWDDLEKGADSLTSPAGYYDWFCAPASEFNKKHTADTADKLYELPSFSNSTEYLYYTRYNSASQGAVTEESVSDFVATALESAPGAYVYFLLPDEDSVRSVTGELGIIGGYSYTPGCIYGKNIYIYVDKDKYKEPQKIDYTYPGDENQQQQPAVTVLEGTTEHIWAKGSKEYSKVTIKPSIKASTYKDAKGKTKQGKLGYVVLSSDTGIEFDTTNHKVTTKSDKSVATVSGKGVVSAKSPGTAYVYAYDTGSFKVEKFTINVAMAPTKLALTSVPGIADKDYLIKKTSLDPGCGELIYLVEEAGNFSVSGGTSYKVVIEGEAKNVLTATEVTRDEKGNQSFTITAKEKPVSATKLAKAKVTVINNESGKKVKVNVTVGNPVTDIVVTGSGSLSKKGDSVDLKVSFVTPYGTGLATTDGVKLAVSLSDPDIDEKKVTLEKGSDIKIKYDKKTGNLKVTAAKDINEGGGVYLLLKDKGSGEWRSYEICYVDSSGNLRI